MKAVTLHRSRLYPFDEPTSRYAAKVFEERMRLEPVRQRAREQQIAQSA